MSAPHAETTVPIVAPPGALDLATSRALATELGDLAGQSASAAILDLSGLSFMDSVGLGVVLKAASRFHRQGKRLAIVSPQGNVRRLFAFAGMEDRLALFETRDEALAFTARSER
jgi:anti-anti-sigma factor